MSSIEEARQKYKTTEEQICENEQIYENKLLSLEQAREILSTGESLRPASNVQSDLSVTVPVQVLSWSIEENEKTLDAFSIDRIEENGLPRPPSIYDSVALDLEAARRASRRTVVESITGIKGLITSGTPGSKKNSEIIELISKHVDFLRVIEIKQLCDLRFGEIINYHAKIEDKKTKRKGLVTIKFGKENTSCSFKNRNRETKKFYISNAASEKEFEALVVSAVESLFQELR